MALLALVQNGAVVNLIRGEPDFTLPNHTVIDITAVSPRPGINWLYDGQDFSPPPDPVITNSGSKAGAARKKRELRRSASTSFERKLLNEVL